MQKKFLKMTKTAKKTTKILEQPNIKVKVFTHSNYMKETAFVKNFLCIPKNFMSNVVWDFF